MSVSNSNGSTSFPLLPHPDAIRLGKHTRLTLRVAKEISKLNGCTYIDILKNNLLSPNKLSTTAIATNNSCRSTDTTIDNTYNNRSHRISDTLSSPLTSPSASPVKKLNVSHSSSALDDTYSHDNFHNETLDSININSLIGSASPSNKLLRRKVLDRKDYFPRKVEEEAINTGKSIADIIKEQLFAGVVSLPATSQPLSSKPSCQYTKAVTGKQGSPSGYTNRVKDTSSRNGRNTVTNNYTSNTLMHSIYSSLSNNEILITVEHCSNCSCHFSLKHDEYKYKNMRDVCLNVVIRQLMSKQPNASVGVALVTDKTMKTPRLGSFEIQIAVKSGSSGLSVYTVFSKIATQRWPTMTAIDRTIDDLMRVHIRSNITFAAKMDCGTAATDIDGGACDSTYEYDIKSIVLNDNKIRWIQRHVTADSDAIASTQTQPQQGI